MSGDDEAGIAVLTIVPEPTGAERDAIVAALVVLSLRRSEETEMVWSADPVSRWQAVARREAVCNGRDHTGWRRDHA